MCLRAMQAGLCSVSASLGRHGSLCLQAAVIHTMRKGALSGGRLDMSKVLTHVLSGGRLVCSWVSRPVPLTSSLSHSMLKIPAVSVDMACLVTPLNVLDADVVYSRIWAATEVSSRVWHALVSAVRWMRSSLVINGHKSFACPLASAPHSTSTHTFTRHCPDCPTRPELHSASLPVLLCLPPI